jgi:hypothetical protein
MEAENRLGRKGRQSNLAAPTNRINYLLPFGHSPWIHLKTIL